jgi:hypothetical protein
MVSTQVLHGRKRVVVGEEDEGVATGTEGQSYVDTLARTGVVGSWTAWWLP